MHDDLRTALEEAWSTTDALFERVAPDALHARPIPLRHPFVFYLGHTPAFAWNQVARGLLGRPSFEPALDELFERGIDPPDERAAAEQAIHEWPDLDAICAYRDRVREELRGAWDAVAALGEADELARGHAIYHVVLEHELMHHETLVYMLHELAAGDRRPPADAPAPRTGSAPAPSTVDVPAGPVVLGTEPGAVAFGWDNELPARRTRVEGFRIDRYPVTVDQYREFVEAGGYADERWWAADDLAWLRAAGLRHPHPWSRAEGTWTHATAFGSIELDRVGGWPARVTHAEAEAYARWAGARLATEAELNRAAYGEPGDGDATRPGRAYPWGDAEPTPAHGNFDLASWDPAPVDAHPLGASAFGVCDLVGNGWEWTSSPFVAHPGFRAWIRTYPGYSADFFDGSHRVLFGGAWPTSKRLLRRSFRNWFQRRYPWAFTTFRCVRSPLRAEG